MRICAKMLGILTASIILPGCTTIVEPNAGSCSVHDYRGRQWAAEGPRACRIAMNRCERWHMNHYPNANWRCMYN
jgi:hypothetical protein